jgi:hypothetical protein
MKSSGFSKFLPGLECFEEHSQQRSGKESNERIPDQPQLKSE